MSFVKCTAVLCAVILAGCAGAQLAPEQIAAKQRDEQRVETMQRVHFGLREYHNRFSSCPAGRNLVLGSEAANTLSDIGFTAAGSASGDIYESNLPPDPGSGAYVYNQLYQGKGYTITFTLEVGARGFGPGTHTATLNSIE